MKSKEQIKQKIENAVDDWMQAKSVAEYFKKKLGTNGSADKVFYNIVEKSLAEERPEWTKVLLDTMKVDAKESPQQVNVFSITAEKIDESLKKLIDVTPKKKANKVEELI